MPASVGKRGLFKSALTETAITMVVGKDKNTSRHKSLQVLGYQGLLECI